MSETCLPEDRVPVLRVPAMPADANAGGSIFGGWIMSHVDVAGSVPALVRAKGPIVTRAVESFEFRKPVFVGDMAKMGWPGQFNFDFMCFLALSASWVMWRNQFSPMGLALGVVAFFGGALFLSGYLLFLSFQGSQSIEEILVGKRAL